MNTFSLPYECKFHLVCFVFSANAQFLHRKIFELSFEFPLVITNDTENEMKRRNVDISHEIYIFVKVRSKAFWEKYDFYEINVKK